jgi:ADP-heptose:LPS heptosyltransferase
MKSIGVYVDSQPIRSIGDTLGVTAVLPILHSQGITEIDVVTLIPELFHNNPYVRDIISPMQVTAEAMLQACRLYECNIVSNYASQLGLSDTNLHPEMYLTDEEAVFGMDILNTLGSGKKIGICLNSSADCRDLRYDIVKPLLQQLKDEGHKLIALGSVRHEDDIFDLSLLGKTTLRQAASIIKGCDLYLGVDTGLFHMAAALNTPQVVFFRNKACSNNKYRSSYFADSLIECGPSCYQPSLSMCHSPHNRCMDNFDLNAYYSLTQKALNT